MFLDASGPLPITKCDLGRIVREAWVRWARRQPDPKPTWLVPYDQLSESDRDADDEIGEAVARMVMLSIAASNGSPAFDAVPKLIEAATLAVNALAPRSDAAAHETCSKLASALAEVTGRPAKLA